MAGSYPKSLEFKVEHQSDATSARLGVVTTEHGVFQTPAFMPVGTQGTVKGILPWELARALGDARSEIILGNTYHLMLRPGPEIVEQLGGLHAFTGWDGPMLTDSGGYQAYSMADINAVDEDGVTFKSIVDGSQVRLTPERAIRVQQQLGADIIMALDDCPPSIDPATMNTSRLRIEAQISKRKLRNYDHARRLEEANDRTVRWLERCARAHAANGYTGSAGGQSLFGIVQGGTDLERRTQSLEQVCNVELPGYAIGGVAVGEDFKEIQRVVSFIGPQLPADKPRYLMGVGYERDIVTAVKSGVDMFDCVLPTRNGRNANAFTPDGQIRLKNARFADDAKPLDWTYAEEVGLERDAIASQVREARALAGLEPGIGSFSRAYVRHLFAAKEMLGPIIVSLHNVRHFQRLMVDTRAAIRDDAWLALEQRWPVIARRETGGVRVPGEGASGA